MLKTTNLTMEELYLREEKYIKASEKVRVDINMASDPIQMLDLSLLCIYFLTGDEGFYKTNRNKLINMIVKNK